MAGSASALAGALAGKKGGRNAKASTQKGGEASQAGAMPGCDSSLSPDEAAKRQAMKSQLACLLDLMELLQRGGEWTKSAVQ